MLVLIVVPFVAAPSAGEDGLSSRDNFSKDEDGSIKVARSADMME